MNAQPVPEIRLGTWTTLAPLVTPVRFQVFVDEQGVPSDMELDEFDALSWHAAALLDGKVVGAGRLLPDGHIGRMAVLAEWRGRGIGQALLRALMAEAGRRGMHRLALSAQTHAVGFYARFGFVPQGAEYEEAGLPHQAMERLAD